MEQLEQVIGYTFKDKALLKRALTHPSYENEQKINKTGHYERIEFLGDAVLELIASEHLFLKFKEMAEGKMTRIRAAAVCEEALSDCGERISLGDYLFLGKGETITGGRTRQSITADVMESVLGAIYLDGGLEAARKFAMKFILFDIEKKTDVYDAKTSLQEIVQRKKMGTIRYILVAERGPEHAKEFECAVCINRVQYGTGVGHNKKEAEQKAAYATLVMLKQ